VGGFFSRLIDSLLEPLMWLLIVGVYLYTLGNPDLGQSTEIFVMQVAKEMHESGFWLGFTFNQQPFFEVPPLYPWIVKVFFDFLGTHLWVARLPAALFGFIGLFLTNSLSVSLLSNRLAGFLTTVMMACSWGYFWCAHDATGNMLWMVLLALFSLLFHWLYQTSARPRLMSWEKKWLPVALGLGVGLMFLLKGIVGLLFPFLLIAGFIGITGNLVRYEPYDWRGFFITLASLVFPWPIWAAAQSGDWTMFFSRFLQLPHVYTTPDETYWTGLLNGLLFWMSPWWVFLVGGCIDPKGFRQIFHKHKEAFTYLMLWIGLGLLLPISLGESSPVILVTAFIPMMILSGLYLTRMLEGIGNTTYYQWAGDGITVLIFGFAVLLTFFIFQYLPDEYPGSLWHMPGPATIQNLFIPLKPDAPLYDTLSKLPLFNKTIPLPLLFPVWKLWLLPLPFFLIFCGMIVYTLNKTERSGDIPPALLLMAVISLLFIGTVALPVTSRPIIEALSGPIQNLPVPVAIHVSRSPDLLRMPFYLDKATFTLTQTPQQLVEYMEKESKGTKPYFVALDEKSYYQLPADLRAKTRVVQSQWQWCLGEQKRAFCWLADKQNQGNFYRMTDELLLLEGLPPEAQQS
jgi:4-amino-4-deoxy-L-arabinose transferase-like glycosyltransferase